MIPLKIELKNFLSYGRGIQKIEFKDYPLICLSGKNGHGKSALLDAMTWALWGQARKISGAVKADAGLLRLGQTQMMVCLEFEFNRNIYKVRREYTKTYGKPIVLLDFELFDKEKDKFISLTDKTIKLTEKKIEGLVGLDFDTFINTAFLRQGQANEFSKKSPKERKQILANILGFSRYDELQKLSSDQARNYNEGKKVSSKLIEQMKKEIEKEEEIEQEQKKESLVFKDIKSQFEKMQKDLLKFESEKHTNLEKKNKHLSLLQEIDEFKNKKAEKEKEFKIAVLEWKSFHYKSLKSDSPEKLENLRTELNLNNKNFLELQQKSLSLQEEILQKKSLYQKETSDFKSSLEKEIYKIRFNLEKEQLAQKQSAELVMQKEKVQKEAKSSLNLKEQDRLLIQNGLNEYSKFAQEYEKAKTQFEKRRSFYQVFIQKGNWVKKQLEELDQRKSAFHDNQSPSCPLCQQVLTVKRKQFLSAKLREEKKFFLHQLDRISGLIKNLKNILLDQNEQIKKLQKEDNQYKQLESKKENLSKEVEQIKIDLKKEEENLNKLDIKEKESLVNIKIIKNVLKEKEKELVEGLKANLEIKKLEKEIAVQEKELADLHYDKKAHLKIQEKLQKIEKSLEELKFLKRDLALQQQRKSKVSFLSAQIKELKKSILSIELKAKKLRFDSKLEKELEKKINDLKDQIKTVLKSKENCLQKLGSLENQMKRIESLKAEEKQKLEEIEQFDDEIECYQLLTQAFGKDGIQALLIEEVIPEIEQEANKILSKLTENRSQIFIESLRDLKKGGVKETLDIQIADVAGIRPYEMFSGGEAFRVDFALRIAISKLLARRAGTALQTLIIDEGFGSQDEEGLNLLMEAIYSIREDFAKIIVVSHLSYFKDNFPIHFVINKNSAGSFVSVEERG